MLYKIEVTKEDIQKGKPLKCNTCPIARAIRRVVGKKRVAVLYGYIKVGNKYAYVSKPNMVEKFIDNFDSADSRRYCRPFSFTLRIGK